MKKKRAEMPLSSMPGDRQSSMLYTVGTLGGVAGLKGSEEHRPLFNKRCSFRGFKTVWNAELMGRSIKQGRWVREGTWSGVISCR